MFPSWGFFTIYLWKYFFMESTGLCESKNLWILFSQSSPRVSYKLLLLLHHDPLKTDHVIFYLFSLLISFLDRLNHHPGTSAAKIDPYSLEAVAETLLQPSNFVLLDTRTICILKEDGRRLVKCLSLDLGMNLEKNVKKETHRALPSSLITCDKKSCESTAVNHVTYSSSVHTCLRIPFFSIQITHIYQSKNDNF